MDLPQSELPEWLKTTATLILGAGAAKLLAVWLENRRLTKKEYRETLLERIRELEKTISEMYQAVTDLRVQVALLEDENGELREKLGMEKKTRESRRSDVHDEISRRDHDSSAP